MPQDYLYIGCTPAYEACAQIGITADAQRYNNIECRAYIAALRKKFGEEPEGARLAVKTQPNDFGAYAEAICYYDTEDAAAIDYASLCEAGLITWAEVGMEPPVKYDDKSQPIIPEEPEFIVVRGSEDGYFYLAGFDQWTGTDRWEPSKFFARRYPQLMAEVLAARFPSKGIWGPAYIVEHKP